MWRRFAFCSFSVASVLAQSHVFSPADSTLGRFATTRKPCTSCKHTQYNSYADRLPVKGSQRCSVRVLALSRQEALALALHNDAAVTGVTRPIGGAGRSGDETTARGGVAGRKRITNNLDKQ